MTLPQPDPAAALARSAIGAMFFSLFGGLWVAAWCVQTYGAHPFRLLSVARIAAFRFLLVRYQCSRHHAVHAVCVLS